jgi:hypothetical protein
MTSPTSSFGDVPGAFMSLLNAQMKLGSDLLQSLTGTSVPSMTTQLQKMSKNMSGSCCAIPAPCWMPQPLCECVSHVSQCKTACIDLVITNCDRTTHPVAVLVSGDGAKDVTVTPASTTIPAFLRGRIKVCYAVPADAKNGTQYEMVILVHGCRDYYLRWTVSIGTLGLDSCHEVAIDDCPDLIHHWYDHFYCARGCQNRANVPGIAANG